MKFLVLGGGAQGSACAFDLVCREDVEHVILADADTCGTRDFLLLFVGGKLERRVVDARDADQVRGAMSGVDAVACALPYYFNLEMTRLAIDVGTHACDLGGNTEIVDQQKELSDLAEGAGVGAVPDCGLVPGMVNVLAQGGIDVMDETESVEMFVGGLPQTPKPPLNYQIVYSMEGMLDNYTTPALVLENGEVVEKETLTGTETVTFEALGELEAFFTAGGISRMPYRYQGQVASMSYKTLRYPGHAALMKAMRDLGLMDLEPRQLSGVPVVPRDVFIDILSERLRHPEGDDLVAMRVIVKGTKDGVPTTVSYELVDYHDEENDVTAMMRTTGYSLAATAYLQASGVIALGVHTCSECMPVDDYVTYLRGRGMMIERAES